MGFFNDIIDAIAGAFRYIRNLIKRFIRGILDFAAHVVGYFRNLNLRQERHIPFLADAKSFKETLRTAPTKNVGIFQGVYDQTTDEIVEHQYVEADGVDSKTKQVLGDEKLVILN